MAGKGFPGGSDSKECACNAGDPGSALDQEDPLEKDMATHSNTRAWKMPMNREDWQALVHKVAKSWT